MITPDTSADTRVLSCGHPPSPHSEHTTGTGRLRDGQEICWDCCHKMDLADLKTADRFLAYLKVPDYQTAGRRYGTIDPRVYACQLTNWPGGPLATGRAWQTRHNIGSVIWRFRATDVHGGQWYGTSPGPEMYARMRRASRE